MLKCPQCGAPMDAVVTSHWVGDVCMNCGWEEPYKHPRKDGEENLLGTVMGCSALLLVVLAVYLFIVLV